jgi:hypothetical protein
VSARGPWRSSIAATSCRTSAICVVGVSYRSKFLRGGRKSWRLFMGTKAALAFAAFRPFDDKDDLYLSSRIGWRPVPPVTEPSDMTSGPQCNSNFVAPRHSRRRIITALTSAAVLLPSARLVAAANATADDERFMRIALDEARQADFPFGAVIVCDGQVLARGRNLGRTNGDPTAHGEMMAIRHCLADHGSAALRAGRSGSMAVMDSASTRPYRHQMLVRRNACGPSPVASWDRTVGWIGVGDFPPVAARVPPLTPPLRLRSSASSGQNWAAAAAAFELSSSKRSRKAPELPLRYSQQFPGILQQAGFPPAIC